MGRRERPGRAEPRRLDPWPIHELATALGALGVPHEVGPTGLTVRVGQRVASRAWDGWRVGWRWGLAHELVDTLEGVVDLLSGHASEVAQAAAEPETDIEDPLWSCCGLLVEGWHCPRCGGCVPWGCPFDHDHDEEKEGQDDETAEALVQSIALVLAEPDSGGADRGVRGGVDPGGGSGDPAGVGHDPTVVDGE